MKHKILTNNFEFSRNFAKILRKYENKNFAATLCSSGVRGVADEPVQPWRTHRTNVDCALFVFLLYCFPFCHLLFLFSVPTGSGLLAPEGGISTDLELLSEEVVEEEDGENIYHFY